MKKKAAKKLNPLTIKVAKDKLEQLACIQNGTNSFAVLENPAAGKPATNENPLFFVIAREELPFLAGWTLQPGGIYGEIHCYNVNCNSPETIRRQLEKKLTKEVLLIK
jgi:hypothetical protein